MEISLEILRRKMKSIQFLKKNISLLIGSIMIVAFIIILVFCRMHQDKEWSNNQKYTEDMLRVQNTESLESPLEAAEYFMKAILDKDVDKALRGCAIDEKCLNNNYKMLMERRQEDKSAMDIAPSADDYCYYPINSAIYTEEYNKQISVLVDTIGKKTLEFKDVDYIKIQEVSLDKYKEQKKRRKLWGAEKIEEVLVKLQDKSGTIYMAGLTVAKYEYGWKVLETGAQEIGMAYQNPIKKVDSKEYLSFIDKERSKKKTSKKKDQSKIMETDDKILLLNYFMLSQKEEKSINRVMEEFTACMQRKDLAGAMNYIKIDANKEFFEAQRDVAEQMKDFCKGIMEIRDTNRNPKLWNTEELTYLGFNGVYDIDKENLENKLVIYYYDKAFFAVGCRFIKVDNQWMIQEFTEIGDGNKSVVKITKEELEQLSEYNR